MARTLEKRIETFKRSDLKRLLNKCTASQVAFFYNIFPSGVRESQLDSAIKICERTIKSNVRRAQEEKKNGKS
jgi:hypothetical protein